MSSAEKKETTKFALLYQGHFVIIRVPYKNLYTLQNIETGDIKGNLNAIHLERYYN